MWVWERGRDEAAARCAALLERAREIAAQVLGPRASATDQGGEPPYDNIRRLAAAGLLGLTVPREHGGHGAPGPVVRAFTEVLAAACGTLWMVAAVRASLRAENGIPRS